MATKSQPPEDHVPFAQWLAEQGDRVLLPRWLDLDALPPLLWADGQAAEVALSLLGLWMKRASNRKSELLDELSKRLDRQSAARFAWTIFEQWNHGGAPAKDKWSFLSLAEWGSDETAGRLARYIREWPAQRKTQRASQGLEILAKIGTDAAVAQLDVAARSNRSRAVQERAEALLQEVAVTRGLSRDELADRIVPTLGFSDDGRLSLDFGPRRFEARLTPDLNVSIVDETGKPRKTLPPASKSDDSALAKAASETFKLVKAQLKEVVASQTARLEEAMVNRRRWRPADWRTYFLEHPLQRLFAQRLVWGVFAANGSLTSTFRVAEDWSLADVDEETVELPQVAEAPADTAMVEVPAGETNDYLVGIPHPLMMPVELRARWGSVFADYSITPPFEQLERETFVIAASEAQDNVLERYQGYMVDGRQLLYQLGKRGWRAGAARAFGSVFYHVHSYAGAEVTAVLHHGGALLGNYQQPAPAAIGGLVFVRSGDEPVQGWGEEPNRRLPLAAVDPIVVSEALRDVSRLAASGTGYDPQWQNKQALG